MPASESPVGRQPSSTAEMVSAIGGISTPVMAARATPSRCASLKYNRNAATEPNAARYSSDAHVRTPARPASHRHSRRRRAATHRAVAHAPGQHRYQRHATARQHQSRAPVCRYRHRRRPAGRCPGPRRRSAARQRTAPRARRSAPRRPRHLLPQPGSGRSRAARASAIRSVHCRTPSARNKTATRPDGMWRSASYTAQ